MSTVPECDQGLPLFDMPVQEQLIVYSSANNLRHYLSMDVILARHFFEAPVVDATCSTLLEHHILVFPRALNHEILHSVSGYHEQAGSTSVALLIDPSQVPPELFVVLIGHDGSLTEGIFGGYSSADHVAIAFPGFLPMSWLKDIIFRETEHQERFQFSNISNVPIPESRFVVDPGFFDGTIRLKLEEIVAAFESNSEQAGNWDQEMRRQNRLRAALHAALSSTVVTVTPGVKVLVDSLILKTLGRSFDRTSEEITMDLNDIRKILCETKPELFSPDFDPLLEEDPTDLIFVLSRIARFFSGMGVGDKGLPRELVERLGDESPERILDRAAFATAVSLLIDRVGLERGQSVLPISILHELVAKLSGDIDALPSDDHHTKRFREILSNRYSKAIGWLEEIQEGYAIGPPLAQRLQAWPEGFSTLRALAVLSTASALGFSAIQTRLQMMGLPMNVRRLVWCLYGAAKGMAGLDASFKRCRRHLDISGAAVWQVMLSPELQRIIPLRDKQPAPPRAWGVGESESGDRLFGNVSFANSLPVACIQEPLEGLREFVIDHLQSETGEEVIKGVMLNDASAEDYCSVYVETSEIRRVSLKENGDGKMIVVLKGANVSVMWDNWHAFRKRFIDFDQGFRNLEHGTTRALVQLFREYVSD